MRIKRECFKVWYRCKSINIKENYKRAKKGAKKALNAAKTQAFDGLYQSLHIKEGEKFIYILAIRIQI
jgi:hypothetical protein